MGASARGDRPATSGFACLDVGEERIRLLAPHPSPFTLCQCARLLALTLVSAVTAGPAMAQGVPPDSLRVPADSSALPSPRSAALRSLAVPGWGQVYVGQPVKAPVVVAAVGGAVAYAAFRQHQYERLRRATLVAGCLQDPDSTPARVDACEGFERFRPTYEALGEPSFAQAAPVRDRARGQRDIGVLIAGVVYALQVLDAYVAAELAGFDVGEDLSVGLTPSGAGTALSVRVRL